MSYSDTIQYLYNLQKYGIKFGLENILSMMSCLGNPHKSFKVIHVAGTNGKGSTSAMIAQILGKTGFRVGLYSSPHLVSFTERIRVNGEKISEEDVIRLTGFIRDKILKDISQLSPTFFEVVTSMAFYYFKERAVDWAVVEVGMGGRLDATNVVEPEATVITNVSLDHMEFLGNSIKEIAHEKAGIIKDSVPVISAVENSDALSVIEDRCREKGCDLSLYGRDFKGFLKEMDASNILFDYSGSRDYLDIHLSLSGIHQLYNSCIAIKVSEILKEKGVRIDESSIRDALSGLQWEGRLERLSDRPLIYLDSAHNPAAALCLSETLKELLPDYKNLILVLGIMKDKDIKGVMMPLLPMCKEAIFTRPDYERAAEPEHLYEIARGLGFSGHVRNRLNDAIDMAMSLWNDGDVILVTGSFYTTGEVKQILGECGVLTRLRE